jgi:hypothetical protein
MGREICLMLAFVLAPLECTRSKEVLKYFDEGVTIN